MNKPLRTQTAQDFEKVLNGLIASGQKPVLASHAIEVQTWTYYPTHTIQMEDGQADFTVKVVDAGIAGIRAAIDQNAPDGWVPVWETYMNVNQNYSIILAKTI